MKGITIIGGGATGILLAVNLMKNAGDQSLEINLVEKNERLGRGVAYGTANDFHLLNVPANKMGAFPDDAEHFYKWIAARNHNFAANDFVPRRLYGEYLRDLFKKTAREKPANVNLSLFGEEAIDVSLKDTGAEVSLNSGDVLTSEKVVLAFGNFLPPHPKTADRRFVSAPKYFQNPWQPDLIEKIGRREDVFVVGTGLTMADTVLSLYYGGHQGKILAVSKHGLLPAVHELGFVYPSFANELKDRTSILELFKIVRRHAENAESKNSDWRGVIDSLRPATQGVWQTLSAAEKSRFRRHLRRIWDVSRHRMPPECAETLERMRAAGQLQIEKGRIRQIEPQADGRFTVGYASGGHAKTVSVDAVVNCTGSESDFAKLDFPLVKNLLGKGYIQPDALAIGIDALADGRVIARDKEISNTFYTIGTALKGVLWESTAMPEIRAQANQLALSLLRQSKSAEVY